MNDQPPAGPPPAAAPPHEPAAEATQSPGSPVAAAGNEPAAAPPRPWRTALIAVAITVAAMAAGAAGYRFYEKQKVDAAADAVRARAYAEAKAALASRAQVQPPATAATVVVATAAPDAVVEPPPVAARKAASPHTRSAPRQPVARASMSDCGKLRRAPVGKAAVEPRSQPAAQEPPAGRLFRVKSVDDLYREQAARECASGFLGLICREWLRASLCWKHDAVGKAPLCPQPPPPPSAGLG